MEDLSDTALTEIELVLDNVLYQMKIATCLGEALAKDNSAMREVFVEINNNVRYLIDRIYPDFKWKENQS